MMGDLSGLSFKRILIGIDTIMVGTMQRISGDFNAQDTKGRVRLNTKGSLEDIKELGSQVKEGIRVLVVDDGKGGFQAEGILELSEGIWYARILWETGKRL